MEKLLLKGAVYALENCGALLRDAVALYDRKSYASAIVMTMFAREELGKYRILRQELEKVAAGGTLQPADLASKEGPIFSHIDKQEQAVLSIVQRPDPGTRLDELLRAQFELEIGSQEWLKLRQELDAVTEAQKKALPKQRHNRRMDAPYVGINETHTDWIRPQEVTQEEAQQEVNHAVGDYNNALSRLGMDPPAGKAFLEAFHAWTDRPQIQPVVEYLKPFLPLH
jgi:AbiV family abortive infection protein